MLEFIRLLSILGGVGWAEVSVDLSFYNSNLPKIYANRNYSLSQDHFEPNLTILIKCKSNFLLQESIVDFEILVIETIY